jgi:hypothetical protein
MPRRVPRSTWTLYALVLAMWYGQTGYLTGTPMADWVGLATSSGRDAVVLGDGCDAAMPGMNVIVLDADHVQLVDPLEGPRPGVCVVSRRLHMSDVACARNPAGLCDVAFE